jgi:endoglucanase
MLRAVWMDDRTTFDRTWRWAVDNLNSRVRRDRLWAWKWGKNASGQWAVLDRAFASDADQDAALALLLAYRRWNDGRYLGAAQAMLNDLWTASVIDIKGRLHLLAGDSLCRASECRVNPSYYAPYAYRIFSKYDRGHPWARLVDASYDDLQQISALTATGLPPDWVLLDLRSGTLRLGEAKESSFSYDALRTIWRVALDGHLNRDPRADGYLGTALKWLVREWHEKQHLPAAISAAGRAQASYEAPEMLSVLMAALRPNAPEVASEMNRRLNRLYKNGVWSEADRYYIQNWAWFGTALYLGELGPLKD